MMHTTRRRGRASTILGLVAVLALVGAACSDDSSDAGSDTDASTTEASEASESADVDAPDEPGPFGVGRTVLELDDTSRTRPLVADVWYPTDATTTGEASVYEFIPGIQFASEMALGDVAVSTEGEFPLVIYSHGSGGLRYVATFFTELLASHGFVVAAVDHVGNTALESIAGTEPSRDEISYNRVLDVDFLIDQMLELSASGEGQFSGSIDPERIGVTGHSYGGFTTFAAVSGFTNDLGEIPGDDRIDAVAAMAPASRLNSDEDLAAVDVPTLLVSGTKDETTPIDPSTTRPWELISGRPLWRVDIEDAGHQSFTDVCSYQELLPTLENVPQPLIDAVDTFAEEGCLPELAPIDEAHDLANRALVSFLLTYVAGQDGYEQFLAEELPGETVEVKE